jgi:hypothetical protein
MTAIHYRGYSYADYRGYRHVLREFHNSAANIHPQWHIRMNAICEDMQDRSPDGYTEDLHRESYCGRPAVDTWAYARSRGCEYPEDYPLPFPYTLMPGHEYWPDVCEDDDDEEE